MAKFLSAYKHLVLVMEPAEFGENKGKRIEFIDGEYETKDKKEISFIKKNPGYGVYITEVDINEIIDEKEEIDEEKGNEETGKTKEERFLDPKMLKKN